MENIVIDILPGVAWPVCHASQCDVGRVIQINIKDISILYSINEEEILTFEMKKPDTTIVTSPVNYSIGSSTIYLTTTEQMCACPGTCLCEIKITKKDYSIGTLNFILEIEEDPGCNIVSVSEIADMEQRIMRAVKKWRS